MLNAAAPVWVPEGPRLMYLPNVSDGSFVPASPIERVEAIPEPGLINPRWAYLRFIWRLVLVGRPDVLYVSLPGVQAVQKDRDGWHVCLWGGQRSTAHRYFYLEPYANIEQKPSRIDQSRDAAPFCVKPAVTWPDYLARAHGYTPWKLATPVNAGPWPEPAMPVFPPRVTPPVFAPWPVPVYAPCPPPIIPGWQMTRQSSWEGIWQ
ncbi:hypothetical protein M406DRAFT_74435 [Cryphonectria parasitica EP155]|uniref:Uncharacterized protein n=1 Tax=Cryphonectria parasitica (strain ATCC 38755 / EP155) TaxID=660469 RepID=A0A9P4XV54_CRYP1|nr:uncharacterized protein M406DRAFT_74435 [Cryphonectria parasitica EP155]KAF3761483.1 hypothetical protein M406DRAFT_74435 [Cryphonectria parasitica EP155]